MSKLCTKEPIEKNKFFSVHEGKIRTKANVNLLRHIDTAVVN